MSDSIADVLLLGYFPARMAATVHDHRDGLVAHSRHRVRPLSVLDRLPRGLDLDRFDAVAVHYSLAALHRDLLTPALLEALAEYDGPKLVFLQDEYQNVNARIAALRAMRAHVLFTCVPTEEAEEVYPRRQLPGLRTVTVLTGYVPVYLLRHEARPLSARRLDVVYRGRRLPYWLGALAQEKSRIAERFGEAARRHRLRVDISCEESDRLYGRAWLDFLGSGRAVLGTESGASVFDFDGSVRRRVEAILADRPGCDFETVAQLVLSELEGRVRLNQISPRMFEAAACRTLMINYSGHYSGILEPWRHYVPLDKDHGNVDEVVEALRDDATVALLTGAAYEEVLSNPEYGYETLARHFDDALNVVLLEQARPRRKPYADADFRRLARVARWRVSRHDGLVGLKSWVADVALPACVPRAHRELALSRLKGLYRALGGGASTSPGGGRR